MGRRPPRLEKLTRSQLLDLRICDLDLAIDGTWLEEIVQKVRGELEARSLRVRPHFWLSDEWFSPDGVPGVAIPFYLAHPKLMQLERSQMLEVEGGTREECTKILRHEVGHAVHHAFRLQHRRKWQQAFGPSSRKYPAYYRPSPASRSYVVHLDYWYAQSHPDEDFAETFAVWLKPRSDWRRQYERWPALQKLNYVDQLMAECADVTPPVRSRKREEPIARIKRTLGEHYELKKQRQVTTYPDVYDDDLRSIFSDDPRHRQSETAAAFLRRNRREIRQLVARWTGEYQFTLDQVLREMIDRAKKLGLRAHGSERQVKLDFATLLTVKTMHHLYGNQHWIPL